MLNEPDTYAVLYLLSSAAPEPITASADVYVSAFITASLLLSQEPREPLHWAAVDFATASVVLT